MKRRHLMGILLAGSVAGCKWNTEPKPDPAERRPTRPKQVEAAFSGLGISKLVLRSGGGPPEVIRVPEAKIRISGETTGGASGYHGAGKVTSASEWGLGFESAQHGDVLVISTVNEIQYIHHMYTIEQLVVAVPEGIEFVHQQRKLSGDGSADLNAPTSP